MSNTNLPKNWLFTTLGKVVDYGKTVQVEPEQIDPSTWVLELEDLEKDTSRLLNRKTFAERNSKSSKNLFEKGDILYGKLRPYLNKVIIADQPGCCTTEIIPIKVPKTLNNRYLFYWLKSPTFLHYVAGQSHGLNMPRLGTAAAKAAPFVLAPISVQSMVADRLDHLLARVDSCRAHLDRAAAAIKRFRQSVLNAAVTGQLTEDWRVKNGGKQPWERLKLGDLFSEKPRNGYSPKSVDYPTSIRSLSLSATTSGVFQDKHFKYLDVAIPDDSHLWLESGDILIQRANSLEYVGISALFTGEKKTFIYRSCSRG